MSIAIFPPSYPYGDFTDPVYHLLFWQQRRSPRSDGPKRHEHRWVIAGNLQPFLLGWGSRDEDDTAGLLQEEAPGRQKQCRRQITEGLHTIQGDGPAVIVKDCLPVGTKNLSRFIRRKQKAMNRGNARSRSPHKNSAEVSTDPPLPHISMIQEDCHDQAGLVSIEFGAGR
jgi:hypothetical protein